VSAPDLETSEGLAAYRAELKAVARWPRLIGFAAIVLGAAFVLGVSQRIGGLGPEAAIYGYGLLAAGWALLIVAFLMRSRYHRRRMALVKESGS